jgi:hypothetical protein
MSRTIGQKAERVLRFLMGARHPRVMHKLEPYGLDDEAIREGWRLLQALSENRAPRERSLQPARSPDLIEALDAWENRWMPITRAVLRRHEPAVHDWMFQGLSMQSGPEVVMSVYLLTQRVRQLEQGVRELGEAATRARARLQQRALGYGIRRRSSIEEEIEEEEMELEQMAAADHPPLRAVPAAK